jgi:predicted FMN-binding regulatory protein PaiB
MVITGLEGKSKLSQNRAAVDQASVAATLHKSGSADDKAVAVAMDEVRNKG